MSRHDSRRVTIQAIFLANGEPNLTIEQVGTKVAKSLDLKVTPAYAHGIAVGVLAKKSEIEADISKCLRKGWCLEQVNRASVAITGVAVFKISQSDVVSAPVAVNEALTLYEESDDPRSKSSISGILANFTPNK